MPGSVDRSGCGRGDPLRELLCPKVRQSSGSRVGAACCCSEFTTGLYPIWLHSSARTYTSLRSLWAWLQAPPV